MKGITKLFPVHKFTIIYTFYTRTQIMEYIVCCLCSGGCASLDTRIIVQPENDSFEYYFIQKICRLRFLTTLALEITTVDTVSVQLHIEVDRF